MKSALLNICNNYQFVSMPENTTTTSVQSDFTAGSETDTHSLEEVARGGDRVGY